MVSLAVFAVALVVTLAVQAWAMAAAARWVGSSRGRMGPAVAAVAVLFVIGIGATVAANATAGAASAAQQWATVGAIWLAELVVCLLVVRRKFRLSTGRALVPFAALLAAVAIDLAVMLFVVRPYIVEAFVIPTASMSPTLEPRDRIAVDKRVARPRRWDLLAYRNPANGAVLCKRLVGLPGETICFDGHGGLTVDGVPVTPPPVLAGRLHAASANRGVRSLYADGEPIRLTDGQFFFVGDNVDGSWDSRMTGPADRSAVIGVVDLIYWPPGHARALR